MATNSDYIDSLCQNTGANHVPFDRPWRGSQHAEDKERFFKFVRNNRYNGHPTRIVEAVKAIYGENYGNTEYRRLSRLANRSDWFVTGPNSTVEVTGECFKTSGLESAVSVSAKDAPSCDSLCQKETSEKTGIESNPETQQYPKDRVQSVLDKRVRLDDGKYNDKHDYRSELLRELATYRAQIEDLFSYFKRKHDLIGLPNYRIVPYTTRYNDAGKAANIRTGFTGALEAATERYNRGAMVSLTVDGKRFESHSDATEAAIKAASDWISREGYQLGFSPEYVRVVDYQENGLIHFHICVFGVRVVDGNTEAGVPTLSEQHVREYWDNKKGIGSQVSVQPIHERGGDWILHDDDGGRQTVRLYLGKRIRELTEISSMAPDELREKVESGDLTLWRHALFWATQRRYYSASESLEDTTESETSGSKYNWEYVGTCRFEQIPEYVIDDSVNYSRKRPPPATASTTELPAAD